MKHLKDEIREGLSELGDTVRRLRGTPEDALLVSLMAFATPDTDDLVLLKQLFDALRPKAWRVD